MQTDSPPSPVREPNVALERVLVWDLPVRLFHWLLVALVTTSAVTGWFAAEIGSQGMEWHKRCGYCILALVLFRLAWGFFGSTHARFAKFVRGPRAVARYAASLLRGSRETHAGHNPVVQYAGHNPLGGWSVVLMLISLGVQTGSGLFISDEDLGVEGPLAHLVSNRINDKMAALHETNFYVLLTLIAVHIAAIVFYLLVKKDNLIRPMLSGYKNVPGDTRQGATSGSAKRAALLLLLAAAIVYWIVG